MREESLLTYFPAKTPRLTIKETTTEDVDLLLKMDKQEVTQKYLGGTKNKTKEERVSFVEKKIKKNKENQAYSLTVYIQETPIGFINLKLLDNSEMELSYIFDSDYTKKGYATESVEKVIEIIFKKTNIEKIIADTVKENLSSQKLLEKLSFIETGNKEIDNVKFINYELKKHQ